MKFCNKYVYDILQVNDLSSCPELNVCATVSDDGVLKVRECTTT